MASHNTTIAFASALLTAPLLLHTVCMVISLLFSVGLRRLANQSIIFMRSALQYNGRQSRLCTVLLLVHTGNVRCTVILRLAHPQDHDRQRTFFYGAVVAGYGERSVILPFCQRYARI